MNSATRIRFESFCRQGSKILREWLSDIDMAMQKQKHRILLCRDEAPVHPTDVHLENIKHIIATGAAAITADYIGIDDLD